MVLQTSLQLKGIQNFNEVKNYIQFSPSGIVFFE